MAQDASFNPEAAELQLALSLLLEQTRVDNTAVDITNALTHAIGNALPEQGMNQIELLEELAPLVLGGAAQLGAEHALAHMDPPTPWITWVTHFWNAARNQNLLHPDVSPVAGVIERAVLQWIAPVFGMTGGHMTPGSTVSNMTALWAARDIANIDTVIASEAAHVSIAKSAHILGLHFKSIECDAGGCLLETALPDSLDRCALVLTAGTTSQGAIDPLHLCGKASWTHIDAAWAGPLQFSTRYKHKLCGIETADSVAMSAHKWLFQPKESGMIMFRNTEMAHQALQSNGSYLSQPNVGLLGSHGAAAIPLFAMLKAWGRAGIEQRINRAMNNAENLVRQLRTLGDVELYSENVSGVVLWRSNRCTTDVILKALPLGVASSTVVDNKAWVRHVSANPNANIDLIIEHISFALNN